MTLEQRVNAFAQLGEALTNLPENTITQWADLAASENSWFTQGTVKLAIEGLVKLLQEEALEKWVVAYSFNESPKQVGIVMAGNIPLVGFHDLLSVLIGGHKAYIKLSSQDRNLIPLVTDLLIEIAYEFKEYIHYADQLKNVDAVIATGSDNSARYFKQYFGSQPNIIRKNRTSCAILTSEETDEELVALGKDIFSYYGLGCRNVSKLFVPQGYNFNHMLDLFQCFEEIGNHSKWRNNYDYNKSIYLVNKEPHLDNGFLLLKEANQLVSPLSVLFYEEYIHLEDLKKTIEFQGDKIQCIVGNSITDLDTVPFGKAQYPEVWDYADGVDTLKFLCDLK